MKTRYSSLVTLFLIFAFCIFNFAFASAATITAIEIQGNNIVSDEAIYDTIASRVGEELIDEKVKIDLKNIYALGYFSDTASDFKKTLEGTKVIFKVTENPILSSIEFKGANVYAKDKLRSLMKTKTQQILNFKNLQDDINSINNLYKKDGYILARIVDVSTPDKNGKITVIASEGIVESITLEGNTGTKDYVIFREINTLPGFPLNENVLSKDLRRVFNLGFFSELTPAFEPGSSKDKIILVLKMAENRSNTINFGGGYGERSGWFGYIDLAVNNLSGTAQALMIRGQWGQELSTYQFKYYNPWFLPNYLGKRTAFTFRSWNSVGRDIYLTLQNETRNGWDVTFGKSLLEEIDGSLSLGSEYVSPTPGTTPTFDAYRSDTIGITMSYDTRDFWMNPTEGKLYTLSLKQGWKTTSGVTAFTKYGVDFNHFHKIVKNHTLAFHLGTGVGLGDVPIGEKYWSGGATTVRGYGPNEIRIGSRKIVGNIEYRLTFSELFQGVLFYDFGDAWDTGWPKTFEAYMSGWGIGLRLTTPLGPIRLDYGVSKGRNFGEGITHFSIGQAF